MIHLTSLLNYIYQTLLLKSTFSFFQKHTLVLSLLYLLFFVISLTCFFIQVLLYNMPHEPKAKRCACIAKARSTY